MCILSGLFHVKQEDLIVLWLADKVSDIVVPEKQVAINVFICCQRKLKTYSVMLQRKYNPTNLESTIVAESRSPYGLKTYVSLFSSAGVGCYGFKQENFYCIATVELLERRLKIQKYNQKCAYDSGYICGDMTQKETQGRVFEELYLWKRNF